MEFAPTWLRQVIPLLHKTTLTTGSSLMEFSGKDVSMLTICYGLTVTVSTQLIDSRQRS